MRSRTRNRGLLCWLAAMLLLPLALWAEEMPRHGLMWNRTGLPLVFPLIVRTDPGLNYRVLLRDAQTGTPALAAFIRGGRYFRVLAPPGTYRVEVAYGGRWKDEDQLFGAGTDVLELGKELTFKVKNFNSKGGHMLDLRGMLSKDAALELRPVRICRFAQPVPRVRVGAQVVRATTTPDLLALPAPLEKLAETIALDVVYPDDTLQQWRSVPRRMRSRQVAC